MFENTAKGWHGSYSVAGRNSAEKFHAIMNKDNILKNRNRKSNIHDIFTPDKPKPKINFTETLDIFKNYTNKKIYNSEDNLISIDNSYRKKYLKQFKKIPQLIKKFIKKDKFKYHEEHWKNIKENNKYNLKNKNKNNNNNNKKTLDPGATKYNPKYEYIWPKLISGPTWEFIPGRKEKKIIDNREFVHDYFDKNMFKSLVNMKKTTQRGDFITMKDIRIRTDKPYVENNEEKNKNRNILNIKKLPKNLLINNNYDNNNNKSEKNIKSDYYSINKNEFNINNNNNIKSHRATKSISILNNNSNKLDTIDSISNSNKNNDSSNINNNNNINNNSRISTIQTFYTNKNLKGPDFSKTISRNKCNKSNSSKSVIPFILANYSQVEERALTMAIYRKPHKKKKYIKQFKGIDPGILFDPDKNIDKINNHYIPKPPNFNLMTCRSSDEKGFNLKLPSYMMNLTNRESCNTVTEKTLRNNNYANSKFMSATTSFWPKRSYNLIVNLNLMNSDKFIKDTDEANNAKREIIKNSLKKKDYEQLIKEGALNKFDNITFKTNKYEYKMNEKEIEKYLINFDNIDV